MIYWTLVLVAGGVANHFGYHYLAMSFWFWGGMRFHYWMRKGLYDFMDSD